MDSSSSSSCSSEVIDDGNSLPSGPDARKRRVSYFHSPTLGTYYFGRNHPMKPHRLTITNSLVTSYLLHEHMQVHTTYPSSSSILTMFHDEEYVAWLENVSLGVRGRRFGVGGEDCPVFEGLWEYCKESVGGTVGGAGELNRGGSDVVVNWGGGLHHAKKNEASGFCYVNDIVIGILELLKVHKRVLYIDIDIHHGDGVEEAFFCTDRVMTVSFHKYGNFFPGTGHISDVGRGAGKYYSLNVPLNDGMDDQSFRSLFRPVIEKVMQVYQPEAVVLQCGADSLAGDRLGCFNLSVKGHADCVRFVRSFNVPLMILGGGGYTLRNVARCWCYETAVAVGVELDNELPDNEYMEYFGPDCTLHVEPSPMENRNSEITLMIIRNTLLELISRMRHAPSVPFQSSPSTIEDPEEPEEPMDQRPIPRIWSGEDYEPGVYYEDERDYEPGVYYEDERDYEPGVFEDERDYEPGVDEDESSGSGSSIASSHSSCSVSSQEDDVVSDASSCVDEN